MVSANIGLVVISILLLWKARSEHTSAIRERERALEHLQSARRIEDAFHRKMKRKQPTRVG